MPYPQPGETNADQKIHDYCRRCARVASGATAQRADSARLRTARKTRAGGRPVAKAQRRTRERSQKPEKADYICTSACCAGQNKNADHVGRKNVRRKSRRRGGEVTNLRPAAGAGIETSARRIHSDQL